jgi:hypothetical protein
LIQRFAGGQALLEGVGPGAQIGIAQRFHLRFERVDAYDILGELAQHALIAAAEQTRQGTIEHRCSGL